MKVFVVEAFLSMLLFPSLAHSINFLEDKRQLEMDNFESFESQNRTLDQRRHENDRNDNHNNHRDTDDKNNEYGNGDNLENVPASPSNDKIDDQENACRGTNKLCTIGVDSSNLYTYYLGTSATLNAVLQLSTKKIQDVTIYYKAPLIPNPPIPKVILSGSTSEQKSLNVPAGMSWTFTIPKEDLGLYTKVTLAITNDSGFDSSIVFKMNFESAKSEERKNDFNIALELVLPICLGVLALIICVGCIFWVRHKRRVLQASQLPGAWINARGDRRSVVNYAPVAAQGSCQTEIDTEPLTAANLNERFPAASFENFQIHFNQTTCSICLEELQKGMICRQLYCKHIFHGECVRLWLLNQLVKGHAFCPNCNKSVMKNGPAAHREVAKIY